MADSILQDLTGISLPVTGTDVLPLARGTDPLAKATVADLVIAQSQVTSLTSDLSGKQPLDADLTAIAALSPSNDDVLQRKAALVVIHARISTFAAAVVEGVAEVAVAAMSCRSFCRSVYVESHAQASIGAKLSTFAGGNVSARRDDDELAFLLRLL